jgi:hypothetical protein
MRRLLIAQRVGGHAHIRLSALTVRYGGGLNKRRGIARPR